MLKSLLSIPLLFVMATPAMADYYNPGGSQQTTCYKNEYREEYVPGTRNSPGYVRRYNERVRVPCNRGGYHGSRPYYGNDDRGYTSDDNSCIEGAIIGGIGGGAVGGAAATQENWIWSIPAGIVGGALIGCQLDGG